jgi:hypothetical protein
VLITIRQPWHHYCHALSSARQTRNHERHRLNRRYIHVTLNVMKLRLTYHSEPVTPTRIVFDLVTLCNILLMTATAKRSMKQHVLQPNLAVTLVLRSTTCLVNLTQLATQRGAEKCLYQRQPLIFAGGPCSPSGVSTYSFLSHENTKLINRILLKWGEKKQAFLPYIFNLTNNRVTYKQRYQAFVREIRVDQYHSTRPVLH